MNIKSKLWRLKVSFWPWWLRTRYGMHIGNNCAISPRTRIDKNINPHGINIGDNVTILKGTVVMAHDMCRSMIADTFIGDNCMIGINSIILPGIHIAPHTVVGAGSVVTKSTPGHCIVAGNPAKVVRTNISVGERGRIIYPNISK